MEPHKLFLQSSGIEYKTSQPKLEKLELYYKLREKLSAVLPDDNDVAGPNTPKNHYLGLNKLHNQTGRPVTLLALRDESDYQQLMSQYAVRRTDPNFWQHSDAVHASHQAKHPYEAGLFDYNRLENR